MSNALNILGYNNTIEYQQKIIDELSSYTEKSINTDCSIAYKNIKTAYFIDNDRWNVDFLSNIKQFNNQSKDRKGENESIFFKFNNVNMNIEAKFIVYSKVFKEQWKLHSVFTTENYFLRQLSYFINEKYPNLSSILDLNIDKANIEWINWLEDNGKKTSRIFYIRHIGKNCIGKTPLACFFEQIYQELFNLTDTREEWDKDIWDIRNLKKYTIRHNKASSKYFIDFTSIKNNRIKKEIKIYFKQRLISNNNFSWEHAIDYARTLKTFINFIMELEPQWNDLKRLERSHIEKFFVWLNEHIKNKSQKNKNPEKQKIELLVMLQKFLSDIQIKEFSIAPIKNVRMLIFSEDKPALKKKPYDQIDYVPDFVLEQFFKNINNLHKEVIPVAYIMFKTGLRISDTLKLKQNCLIKLNKKFWIECDIGKTFIQGHRIPIDEELANMVAVLIHNTKQNSNQDNNPENYIFVRYNGLRKGYPYSSIWVQRCLNAFAIEYNITDELENIYHFKNHAFRHTYAIKMLNGGADILTVQDLLAHASPEMTMRYAKLLDDTKRKVFEKAIKQGIFSFDIDGKLYEETNEEVPENILDMLWTNHKLNAIDTPYGTCLQRTNGKCSFAKQPPCLTCNAGKPCKDLGVGIFEGDIKKYEIHINSAKAFIEQAKIFNREDMASENIELLNFYEEIYNKISTGNIVYGRLERLMKQGDTNE